jgi:O-antigen/teichoic acid export membrane protein
LISESAPQAAQAPRPGLARNALHLGVGQVITTVLTVLLSAAIARTLGAADFGLLYLLSSIAGFAYVFVDWGHGPYVTREVARRPERSGELLGSVLVVRAVTAVIMGGLAVVIAWLLGYDLRMCLLAGLFIMAWLPQYLGLTYSWVFRGRERMEYDALIQVVLKSSTLVIALACLWLGGRLLALMLVYALAGTITFALSMRLYRWLGFPALHVSWSTSRELIRDGAPMLAISLAVAVQPYIDANLLYKLAPTAVVGWYGAAWAIAGTLVAPAGILGAAMYPRLSRVSVDRVEFSHTLRTAFRPLLLVAVLGAVGMYLFADFAISVIYSKQKFGPAADIVRAFTPALLLIYVDMLFGYAILAVGKAGQLAKAKVLAVVVTTIVELILIPLCQARFSNGGIGIVLAMACGELVMVTAAILLIRDVVAGAMALDVFRGLVAGAATVGLIRWLPPITPLLGIPLCVATYAVMAAVVGLVRRDDLALLTSMFRKRGSLAAEGASRQA